MKGDSGTQNVRGAFGGWLPEFCPELVQLAKHDTTELIRGIRACVGSDLKMRPKIASEGVAKRVVKRPVCLLTPTSWPPLPALFQSIRRSLQNRSRHTVKVFGDSLHAIYVPSVRGVGLGYATFARPLHLLHCISSLAVCCHFILKDRVARARVVGRPSPHLSHLSCTSQMRLTNSD